MLSIPAGLESYAKVRLWGAGGQAGFNASGQAGGSGAAGYYIETQLLYLNHHQNIHIGVGEPGGAGATQEGGRGYYRTASPAIQTSGGWGGWQGHKNAGSYGAGGGGGAASIFLKGNIVIAAAGGGGGGGGASQNHAGGNGINATGAYAVGAGQPGQEMIGNGAGGGGGGGGPQAGGRGLNGPDGERGGGGGSSGGYLLTAAGGGTVHVPVGRTPFQYDDGSFSFGQGGLSNGASGSGGYAEIEFTFGGVGNIKENGAWYEVASAYYKESGAWKQIKTVYRRDSTGTNNDVTNWKIVDSEEVRNWHIFTPDASLYGRADRVAQYTEPPPPPPAPVVQDWDDWGWEDYHDNNSDQDGGAGDSGGGDSIICTALNRLGYLPDHIYQADQKFGECMKLHDPDVYKGYLKWAEHVVGWLENKDDSNIMPWIKDNKTRIKKTKQWALNWTLPIATPWTTEMAYQMGYVDKGSYVGKLLMLIGKPICRHLAKNNRKVEKKHLIILLSVLGVARFISMFSLTNYNVQSHRRSINDVRRV